jgi:hypothetical protein
MPNLIRDEAREEPKGFFELPAGLLRVGHRLLSMFKEKFQNFFGKLFKNF